MPQRVRAEPDGELVDWAVRSLWVTRSRRGPQVLDQAPRNSREGRPGGSSELRGGRMGGASD